MSIGEAAHNSNIVLNGSGIKCEHRGWQVRHSNPRLHELRNRVVLMGGPERFGSPVDEERVGLGYPAKRIDVQSPFN